MHIPNHSVLTDILIILDIFSYTYSEKLRSNVIPSFFLLTIFFNKCLLVDIQANFYNHLVLQIEF